MSGLYPRVSRCTLWPIRSEVLRRNLGDVKKSFLWSSRLCTWSFIDMHLWLRSNPNADRDISEDFGNEKWSTKGYQKHQKPVRNGLVFQKEVPCLRQGDFNIRYSPPWILYRSVRNFLWYLSAFFLSNEANMSIVTKLSRPAAETRHDSFGRPVLFYTVHRTDTQLPLNLHDLLFVALQFCVSA